MCNVGQLESKSCYREEKKPAMSAGLTLSPHAASCSCSAPVSHPHSPTAVGLCVCLCTSTRTRACLSWKSLSQSLLVWQGRRRKAWVVQTLCGYCHACALAAIDHRGTAARAQAPVSAMLRQPQHITQAAEQHCGIRCRGAFVVWCITDVAFVQRCGGLLRARARRNKSLCISGAHASIVRQGS